MFKEYINLKVYRNKNVSDRLHPQTTKERIYIVKDRYIDNCQADMQKKKYGD